MDNIDALDDAVKRYPLGVTAAIHARFLALGSIIASQQAAISKLTRPTSRVLTQDLEALMEAIESAQRRIDEIEELARLTQPSPNEIVNRALLDIGSPAVIAERLKSIDETLKRMDRRDSKKIRKR